MDRRNPVLRYIWKVESKAKWLYMMNADHQNGDPYWPDLTPIQKHLWIMQVKQEELVKRDNVKGLF